MDKTRDLLIEIGTEELPPTALHGLMESFHSEVIQGLDKANLRYGKHRSFATPRRLAIIVENLLVQQPDQQIERRGPALKAAFDAAGKPTRAAQGFAESCGVTVSALNTLETEKGAWLLYRGIQHGAPATDLIGGIVDHALTRLPIPRRMRWGTGESTFVRPIHWIILLLGEAVIDTTVFGIKSGNQTRGHRFHAPEPITISTPGSYEQTLETDGFVIADFDKRRALVYQQAQAEGQRLGCTVIIKPDLLDEVTALVEWPVAISGSFDAAFLRVPAEALISSMQGHQKYFPVQDAKGQLAARFITIANLQSLKPAEVAKGNERVIRPRLADAAFFWDQDKKTPLSQRIESLKHVVFQQQLGSLYDKSVRVASLAKQLAPSFGIEQKVAEEAALLAKCDLLTEMVGEFPELQGIMGRYYAEHDGHTNAIPASLDEQYLPRFAGDSLPPSALGQLLAIADRVDTLIGIFAIGQAPTGDKDPFALRRSALGLMRILVECKRRLPLLVTLQTAAAHLPEAVNGSSHALAVFDFCMDRLKAYYLDQGYTPELFDAVRSVQIPRANAVFQPVDDPLDFDQRLRACASFLALPAASSLAAANKRVKNILRKANHQKGTATNPDLFQTSEEKHLFNAVEPMLVTVQALTEKGHYEAALTQMANIRESVDGFFEKVMVMADDKDVQRNRLALLDRLSTLFDTVADISKLPDN